MPIKTTLSKLTNAISSIPKPPISMLRLGGMATPIGAGLVVGSVIGMKAIEHRGEIKTTLGNLVSKAKSAGKSLTTIGDKPKVEEEKDSMLIPLLLLGGCSLIVIFVIMKK